MDHRRHNPVDVVLKQFAICFNSFALFVDGTINKKMYLRHKNTFSRGFSVDVIYHSQPGT